VYTEPRAYLNMLFERYPYAKSENAAADQDRRKIAEFQQRKPAQVEWLDSLLQ
jgi:hypothetical protein